MGIFGGRQPERARSAEWKGFNGSDGAVMVMDGDTEAKSALPLPDYKLIEDVPWPSICQPRCKIVYL